ncbi:MAG: ATP-binding cassette domain-containing protein [Planctomycetota bacterium]
MSEEIVLETRDLVRRFGAVTAVDGLSLRIRRGDVYGFLGLNGSGKTTTLRCALDLLAPSAGEVRLFGVASAAGRRAARARIGAMVEAPAFFSHLSGRRNLALLAGLSGPLARNAIDEVLELVGLEAAADRRAGHYSLGMKQRLAIALALVGQPEFVILDEPTNGLDPNGILEMRRLIQRLNRERGVTFLVSSHLIHEIELVGTRVAIIDRGRLLLEEPMEGLAERLGAGYRLRARDLPGARKVLAALGARDLADGDGELRFGYEETALPDLHAELARAECGLLTLEARRRSLEELFLELAARDAGTLT